MVKGRTGARAASVADEIGRPDGWTPARRTLFLEHLAASANVRQSIKAVGMSFRGAYALRTRDAGFAAEWQAALETGYSRLEEELLARALGGGPFEQAEGGLVADPPLDPALALALLARRDAQQRAGRTGASCERASVEEVERVLRRKLDMLAKRLGKTL